MSLHRTTWLFTLALCVGVVTVVPRAQTRPRTTATEAGSIETVQIRPNVYVLAGGGANIVVHVGWMGAVLVDSGSEANSDAVLAAVQRITDEKIRYIINTTADADHVGGNAVLSRAGSNLGAVSGLFSALVTGAGITAHENVVKRMSADVNGRPMFPAEGWPTEALTGGHVRSLYLNGDGIQIVYQPAAHSDGDSIVHFRKTDVIASGPLVDLRTFPVIDLAHGGSIDGLIRALNNLVQLAIPPSPLIWHEDRTFIVPAHGRVMDHADAVEYRDMVVIIRDRIADLINKGMTIDRIIKADPTKEYRGQYGPSTGPWTNEMFIRSVHSSLTGKL